MRFFTTVFAMNGSLSWVYFAIAALACVFLSEAVCIVFLVRRMLASRKTKQKEKEERKRTSFFGIAPLFVAGGVVRPVEIWLTVLCILTLAGAAVCAVLFLICYRKGYLFDLGRYAEKGRDWVFGKEDPRSYGRIADEDTNRAIAAFAQERNEESAPVFEDANISPLDAFFDDETVTNSVSVEDAVFPDEETTADNLADGENDDAETDEDDDGGSDNQDRFTGNERIIGFDETSGCYVVARYRKSFEAKLIQSQPNIKKYYSELKNALLSYKGTKSRMSWTADSFHNGRTQLAKINVKTRILELYLALDPTSLEGSVYRGQDVGALKKYEETPFRYKIRTPRKFKWALELIHRVCEEHELVPIDAQPVNYAKQYPFDTIDNLVSRKLVKVTTRLEKSATTFELDEEKLPEEENVELPIKTESRSWAYDDEEQPIVETEQIAADMVIPEQEDSFEEIESKPSGETIRIAQIRYTEHEGENGEPVSVTDRVITDAPIDALVDESDASQPEEEPEAATAFAEVGENETSVAENDSAEPFGENDAAYRSEKETESASLFSFDDERGGNELTADDFADVTFANEEDGEQDPETFGQEKPTYADPQYEDVIVEELPRKKEETPWDTLSQEARLSSEKDDVPAFAQSAGSNPQIATSAGKKRTNSDLAIVDVALLDINFEDGDVVTLEVLRRHGLAPAAATRLKVRASGKMQHALTVVANQFTYDALLAIGEAGGETQFIK